MAVCPFWRPWPRTSVTVMPGMFIFSRASRTSSTLFGRTTLLMSFIGSLQGVYEFLPERLLVAIAQLAPLLGHVQHVDGLAAFGGDEDQVHVAALVGDCA